MNFAILFAAAAVPLVTGFIWYSDFLFGKAWKKVSGVDPNGDKSKFWLVLVLSYVLGVLLAAAMLPVVVHQMHVGSIFADIPGSNEPGSDMMIFMEKYGHLYRTFKHGALHGTIAGIFTALPLLGISALFESRGWKYIWIHTGYWTLTLALMGGIICQWF